MEENKTNVCGIIALIFGIVGLFIFGYPLGGAAIVLGSVGLKTQSGKGLAIAGLVLGIIDVVLLLILQLAKVGV